MAYESYYTNKIIKTTKAQYDALKNGESVKGYKFNEKDTFVKIMNQKAIFLDYTSSIKICVFT